MIQLVDLELVATATVVMLTLRPWRLCRSLNEMGIDLGSERDGHAGGLRACVIFPTLAK